jgi:Lrp/AsnC family transcriptional regulator, regulator for asnA, asnC and gidA
MDNLDYLILSEIVKNPQIPFSHIARTLKISQNTVKKKYEQMVKKNIIIGSSIIIDLSKIGFEGMASFSIITEKKALTIEALQKIFNVFIIVETVGDYDIRAMAIIKNYAGMMTLVKEIQAIPTIKQVDVVLRTETLFPMFSQYNNNVYPYLKELSDRSLKTETIK